MGERLTASSVTYVPKEGVMLSDIQIESFLPLELRERFNLSDQKLIPYLAKEPEVLASIKRSIDKLASNHKIVNGDSRRMADIPDNSVHLAVTSPPYWTLKKYPDRDGQLGGIENYEKFLTLLNEVWREVYRVLVPGGRLVVVVGDVCLSRRAYGRHVVFPLHASIQEHCRGIGFDNLAPIIWYKISNANFEVKNGSSFLGKPYEPNAVIKNDIEYILFQRKPGGYRSPDFKARLLSVIPGTDHKEWFNQIWNIGGASTKHHPAPFPLAVAERLIRMFSFVGDTVLDPFMGTGTTNLAAYLWGRNSIGYDIEPAYVDMSLQRIKSKSIKVDLFSSTSEEALG
ncbi:MAG: DNA-methyltransferase [bacterium]|jgi:DNA modification methylase